MTRAMWPGRVGAKTKEKVTASSRRVKWAGAHKRASWLDLAGTAPAEMRTAPHDGEFCYYPAVCMPHAAHSARGLLPAPPPSGQ